MHNYPKHPHLNNEMLPVDIVLHPSWWHHQTGLTFDEDFFFHPQKRVESERLMERTLYERWGQYGLGQDHATDRPHIGAVHLAAGFLLSEMLGCRIEYQADAAPQVIEARVDALEIQPERAFSSPAFKRFVNLTETLKRQYGYISGDVNWSGILNLALDVRGQQLFMDMFDKPEQAGALFNDIAGVIHTFVAGFEQETGSSSISVNRNVRHVAEPVFLHSECSHTMISVKDYERYLLPFDIEWSRAHRPYGIHYSGHGNFPPACR